MQGLHDKVHGKKTRRVTLGLIAAATPARDHFPEMVTVKWIAQRLVVRPMHSEEVDRYWSAARLPHRRRHTCQED